MFRALTLLVALSLTAAVIDAHAQDTSGFRLEAAAGKCRYGKAQDGAWNKINYEQNLHLTTTCYSFGVSQVPFETPVGGLGWRLSYVDFGLAQAQNYVPARDDEANSFPSGQNCDKATYSGCVGKYDQWGRASGFTLGPVLEKRTGYGTFGAEAGIFRYKSYWQVHGEIPGPGTCPNCTNPDHVDWNRAGGIHYTWYLGATYEVKGFFVQGRVYHSTYASQAKIDPGYVGLISGPLYSLQVGYQFKF